MTSHTHTHDPISTKSAGEMAYSKQTKGDTDRETEYDTLPQLLT